VTKALRIWWDAQRSRDNYGEFAQAVLRVGLGFILITAYLPWVDWGTHTWVPLVYWGFVAYTLALFVWIYRTRKTPRFVRYLTVAVDMGAATVLLGLTGDRNAIMLFVYTWMALGHGFRFGLHYLYYAWIAGVVGSLLVFALSAAVGGFWYRYPLVWLGTFVWVVAPTYYIAYLLKQVAARAAEEARVQVQRAEAERARAEAEAASEAKSEFLATMSHEMRTPLNGVVGAAELLAGTDLPQRERQLVDWLLTSSRQLRSLIDNLLDLRKIEAGKMTIERSPLDVHTLMNRVAAMFEPDAKRAHLRFTKSISVTAPYLLVGDYARIQQVLINLVGNALKFTRQGFVRVSAAAAEQDEHQVTLRFEVRDTGIGIAEDNAGRIFDRFMQADNSIHRQYGGSGLGTTICKHLVGLMGGTIGFDSAPGRGTTFWFTVPLSRPTAEAYEDGATVSVRGAHVHLVSGRPGESAWLARTVRERQIRLSSFHTLSGAIESARKDPNPRSSLLLVDGEDEQLVWHDMPDALRQEGVQLPCVLLHGGVSETKAFDAGYACLLESRDPSLLVRAVRSIVAGSSSTELAADFPGDETSVRKGLHILVAEDNQISQQIIAMMLQAGGHVVTLVGDGDSVLDTYRKAAFDLVILDMHMPGRTGLEVAKAIRTLEAASGDSRMPIIMLTAAASTDLREESLDAGVDLFLSKPVDPRALLRGVDQVVSEPGQEDRSPVEPPARQGGAVDHVLLKDMADLARDPAFLRALADKFLAEASRLLDLIEAAAVAGDRPRFQELIHALKGTAMMAGAVRLRDSVARAEAIAETGFDGVGAELIGEMKAALEATNLELTQMVA